MQSMAGSASDNAVRAAAWRVIPLLAVGYIVSYIDRANVGFAALTMNRDLGLSATQFGFAAGTFYFGYVLFEVPSNLALRRFGARRWLARIMISWGLAAAATSLAVGPVSFSACRFLTGVCEAGFYPGVMFYLSTWFPVEVRARVFAWFNVANPMSSVISGPVSTALLKMNGVGGVAGWRWLLLCEGLPACALGLYTLYALPHRLRVSGRRICAVGVRGLIADHDRGHFRRLGGHELMQAGDLQLASKVSSRRRRSGRDGICEFRRQSRRLFRPVHDWVAKGHYRILH